MTELREKSEILFLYQVRDCNPNGDPLEENQPRMDPDTCVATISDVRIKRTIRDYWRHAHEPGLEIWIDTEPGPDNLPMTSSGRRKRFEEASGQPPGSFKEAVLARCVDARTFGCILAVAKSADNATGGKRGQRAGRKTAQAVSTEVAEDGAPQAAAGSPASEPTTGTEVAVTGPVQFSGFNRSLHRVSVQMVQGTAAFASKEGAKQRSFRTDFLLPYALIGVYGVVNEIAARFTKMSAEDRELVLEGLWRGTDNLHSRSKMGHQPIALLELADAGGRRIGDLPARLRLVPREGLEETALRGLQDFHVDATELASSIGAAVGAGRLTRIRFRQDPRLALLAAGQPFVTFLKTLTDARCQVELEAFSSW